MAAADAAFEISRPVDSLSPERCSLVLWLGSLGKSALPQECQSR